MRRMYITYVIRWEAAWLRLWQSAWNCSGIEGGWAFTQACLWFWTRKVTMIRPPKVETLQPSIRWTPPQSGPQSYGGLFVKCIARKQDFSLFPGHSLSAGGLGGWTSKLLSPTSVDVVLWLEKFIEENSVCWPSFLHLFSTILTHSKHLQLNVWWYVRWQYHMIYNAL